MIAPTKYVSWNQSYGNPSTLYRVCPLCNCSFMTIKYVRVL